MGRQSWKGAEQVGGSTARRLVRGLAGLALLALFLCFVWLLKSPFAHPRAHFCLLSASPQQILGSPRVDYLAQDLAAFESLAHTLARHRFAREAVRLDQLRSRAEMSTLAKDLKRAVTNPADVLVLYLATAGMEEAGTPYLLCGNFEVTNLDASRYPLRSLLEQVHDCPTAAKLLILDCGREVYDPRLGKLADGFSRLLRDEVQRTQDPTLWVLTANAELERSHVSRALERSLFGYVVTAGLQGAADLDGDRAVTVDELYRYVAVNVATLAKAVTHECETQTPELLWGGGTLPPPTAYPNLVTLPKGKLEAEPQRLASAIASASSASRTAAYAHLVKWTALAARPEAGSAGTAATPAESAAASTAPAESASPTGAEPAGRVADAAGAAAPAGAEKLTTADSPTVATSAASATDQPGVRTASAENPKPVVASPGEEQKLAAPTPADAAAKDASAAPTTSDEAASAWARHAAELLMDGWRLRDALAARPSSAPVTPVDYAPRVWRELQERLLRYEQRFRAGAIQDEKAFADELEDLVVALRQFSAGELVVGGRGGAVVEQLARWRAPRWPTAEATPSLGLAEYLARRRGLPLRPELQSCAAALDRLLADEDETKFKTWVAQAVTPESQRFSELWLARRLAAEPRIAWSEKRLALRVRRLAEQVAASSLDCLPWVRDRLAAADRVRWEAERALCDRIGPNWQQQVREQLTRAEGEYRAIAQAASQLATIRQLAQTLATRAPDYVRWRIAVGGDARPGLPGDEVMEGFLDALAKTLAFLEQPDPANLPDLIRQGTILAPYRQQLFEPGFQDQAVAAWIDKPGDAWRIESLLTTSLPSALTRWRLLTAASEVESLTLSRVSFPDIQAFGPSSSQRTQRDWQRLLAQVRCELKLCRLAAFCPIADGLPEDPDFEELVKTCRQLEQSVGSPGSETTAPQALADFGTALRAFCQLLPRRVQRLVQENTDLRNPVTRNARLQTLRAAQRAEIFVDPRDARLLADVHLHETLARAQVYDWLAWAQRRVLQMQEDATEDETRVLAEAERTYRTLASSVEGQPDLPGGLAAPVTLAAPSSASLVATPQTDLTVALKNITSEPVKVWLILHYDAGVLEVEAPFGQVLHRQPLAGQGGTAETSPERLYPFRPDRLELPPTCRLSRGETLSLKLRVKRKNPASAATCLAMKAVAIGPEAGASSYTRYPVDIELPNTEAFVLQASGTPGTWSEKDGHLALHPFANRSTKYQLRLLNPLAQNKKVELRWLNAEGLRDLSLPRGSLSAAVAEQLMLRLLHIDKEDGEVSDASGVRVAKLHSARGRKTERHAMAGEERTASSTSRFPAAGPRLDLENQPVATGDSEVPDRQSQLFADVRQQGHESRPLDRLGHGVLAGCRATGFAASDNPAVTVDQLAQEFAVLVIDVHRSRPLAVNEQRVLLPRTDPGLDTFLEFGGFALKHDCSTVPVRIESSHDAFTEPRILRITAVNARQSGREFWFV